MAALAISGPIRPVVYDPLPSQRKFHLLTSRFKGFSGPVGSGKTNALDMEALRLAYANPGVPGLLGAPTYTMLRDVTRAQFLETLVANRVPHEFRIADNEVVLFEPRSVVRFRSLDNPLRLVGSNLAWFGLDELTYSKADAWRRMCARLRHPKAKELCGFAVWTPKGFDWVYDGFIGPDKWDGYEVVLANPGENTHLPPDFYDRLKTSYDQRFFEQEVLGKYLAQFTGQIYWSFDRRRNIRDLKFDPAWPLCWSLDFNIDPMCSTLSQVVETSDRVEMLRGIRKFEIRILDEIVIADCRTAQVVDAFFTRIEPLIKQGLRRLYLYGDATGNSRQRQSNRSDWDVIKEGLRRDGRLQVESRVPTTNGPVVARVNALNGLLKNAAGDATMLIDPRCKELTKDFEQLAWPRDNAGNALTDRIPDADSKRAHTSDTVGYLAVAETKQKGGPQKDMLF